MQPQDKTNEKYKRIQKLGHQYDSNTQLVHGTISDRVMVLYTYDASNLDKGSYVQARLKKCLDHPNILKVYDVYKTKKEKLIIVSEFAEG